MTMIYGIGIDIVEVGRIQRSWEEHGDAMFDKILTEREVQMVYSLSTRRTIHFVAKSFAIKEAFVKALGTGFNEKITPLDVSTDRITGTRPEILYSEKVRILLDEKQICAIHCSVSDEEHYVVANVLMERNK